MSLATELTTDPLGRGYSQMSDAEVVADLYTEYRTEQVKSLTGDQMFNATDTAEWAALTDTQKSLWMSFCSRQSVDPFGTANVAFVTSLFGAGSNTVAALGALRVRAINRAQELGLGQVKVGHIQMVRS